MMMPLGITLPFDTPRETRTLALCLWWLVAGVSLFTAALFSGCEIGIYSLSKIRLRLRVAKKDKHALLLNDWFQRPTYALEGLLVLQNLSSFCFAAAVTQILSLEGFSGAGQTLISIAIVTPAVLVFGDIMPKDLFHTHADVWVYRLVPTMKSFFRAITVIPLLPIVNFLSRVSVSLVGAKAGGKRENTILGPRAEILTLFQESAATGLLTGTQQDLVQRALRLARISVRECMIPWNRVVGVPPSISRDGFCALVKHYNVSRMPVLGRSTTEVLGIVDVLDVLTPAPPPAAIARPRFSPE